MGGKGLPGSPPMSPPGCQEHQLSNGIDQVQAKALPPTVFYLRSLGTRLPVLSEIFQEMQH